MLLLFAAMVGSAAGILTWMSDATIPQALMAAGAAAGTGLLLAMVMVRGRG
ncbi:hypothetical protein ACIA8R_35085 [Nonomuraea sp. NPDC051191]|uniref:hypothetical protein n=1 Tax=Nonomuraea sp. NPDC051191 TaxID=3364372 RepID=UPI0037A131F2